MALKKITDPEEVLLLWQAGLIVTRHGRPWVRYSQWKEREYQDVEGSIRRGMESGGSYIIVEDEGAERDLCDSTTMEESTCDEI